MKRFVIDKEVKVKQSILVPFSFDNSKHVEDRLLEADAVRFDNVNPRYNAMYDTSAILKSKIIVDAKTKEEATQLAIEMDSEPESIRFDKIRLNGFIGSLNVVTEPNKLSAKFVQDLERIARKAALEGKINIEPTSSANIEITKNIEISPDKNPKIPSDKAYSIEQTGQILERKRFEIYYEGGKKDADTGLIELVNLSPSKIENAKSLIVTADVKSEIKGHEIVQTLDQSPQADSVISMRVIGLESPKGKSNPSILSESTMSTLLESLEEADLVDVVESKFHRTSMSAALKTLSSNKNREVGLAP